MGAGLGVRSLSDSRQALQLGFSFARVNTHVARMYTKLGAPRRSEWVRPVRLIVCRLLFVDDWSPGMPDVDLFQRALGLAEPWQVVDVKFDAGQRPWICGSTFPRARSSRALSVGGRAVRCMTPRATRGAI